MALRSRVQYWVAGRKQTRSSTGSPFSWTVLRRRSGCRKNHRHYVARRFTASDESPDHAALERNKPDGIGHPRSAELPRGFHVCGGVGSGKKPKGRCLTFGCPQYLIVHHVVGFSTRHQQQEANMNRRVLFFAAAAAVILAASSATAVYAAGQWYQLVCQKCGWHGRKIQVNNPSRDSECQQYVNGKKCGGLCKDTPCGPPG